MSKIKVSIVNPYTLKLEEKGEVGDIIDLQELQKVDNSLIIDAIQKAKDETYKALLSKEIEQQEANKKIALNELERKMSIDFEQIRKDKERLSFIVEGFSEKLEIEKESAKITLMTEYSIEKARLESKITELENSFEEQKKFIELQIEKKKDDEFILKIDEYKNQLMDKQNQVDKLVFDLQSLSEKQQLIVAQEKSQVKLEYELNLSAKEKAISDLKLDIELLKSKEREAILNKENEISLLSEQLKGKDEIQRMELEKELSSLKQTFTELLSQKDIELMQLRLSKSNLQIKTLGEELEKWCNAEYESYSLAGFNNCKWFKDNRAIKDSPDEKGTKADYIFEVYIDDHRKDTDKLLSVCCEMKNESPETKNKTKNSDHYDKLEKDRVKKNCQYSLLISELEWDAVNDVPIKKIVDFENMYLVRPAYFISFLSLIKSLAGKYQSLIVEHKLADFSFKESQTILDEFETFKSTYLDKPLESLIKDVEDIKREANKAYESSYKIVGLADKIISNKISEIKVKIERFDIKKIARKVEKMHKLPQSNT